ARRRVWFLRDQGSLLLSCSRDILDFVEKRLHKILRRAKGTAQRCPFSSIQLLNLNRFKTHTV
ncbi:hypothetical protein ACTNEA_11995, partial [Oscillospiraceae bacterium HCP3S3_F4]